jgi:hypothetical protein
MRTLNHAYSDDHASTIGFDLAYNIVNEMDAKELAASLEVAGAGHTAALVDVIAAMTESDFENFYFYVYLKLF